MLEKEENYLSSQGSMLSVTLGWHAGCTGMTWHAVGIELFFIKGDKRFHMYWGVHRG